MADGLDEAVRLIEDLRNREGVEDTHLYEVEEVPIQFHAYYRVEVSADSRPAADFAVEPSPADVLAVQVVDSIQDAQAVDIDQAVMPENTHEAVETPTFGIFSRP
ncbi:MAG: hypothetical protein IT198_08780 [Acidimicrobiia bacterium]|nr:hypothetical protein [Acidimicrobiia bacterium]